LDWLETGGQPTLCHTGHGTNNNGANRRGLRHFPLNTISVEVPCASTLPNLLALLALVLRQRGIGLRLAMG
jgi:hypothetical protein